MDYPKAPEGTLSLWRYLAQTDKAHSQWVGGRLSLHQKNQLYLSGQGHSLEVCWDGPAPLVAQVGDDIALKLSWGPSGAVATEGVVLVASGLGALEPLNPWASKWSRFLQELRRVLADLQLEEVQTPSLVVNPGMEVHLSAFKTEWTFGRQRKTVFLPTSPELHMKQLLAKGWTDIYEIKTCFRSEELSPLHEPEFTLLEWYRAFSDLKQIESDLKKLLRYFDSGIEFIETDISASWKSSGIEDFHQYWVEAFEPQLPKQKAVFVWGFPAAEAALARIDQNGVAERFELYYKGIELANAFQELNDPKEQRQRHLAEQGERQKQGLEVYPLDEGFLGALQAGMPPSGGIALGLDRLFMCLYDVPRIEDLRHFSAKLHLSRED